MRRKITTTSGTYCLDRLDKILPIMDQIMVTLSKEQITTTRGAKHLTTSNQITIQLGLKRGTQIMSACKGNKG